MAPRFSESSLIRLSAAIQVSSARNGRPLSSATFAFLKPTGAWIPRLTSDDYHVFTGMPPGSYLVRVAAPAHTPREVTIEISSGPTLENAILGIELEPEVGSTGDRIDSNRTPR